MKINKIAIILLKIISNQNQQHLHQLIQKKWTKEKNGIAIWKHIKKCIWYNRILSGARSEWYQQNLWWIKVKLPFVSFHVKLLKFEKNSFI